MELVVEGPHWHIIYEVAEHRLVLDDLLFDAACLSGWGGCVKPRCASTTLLVLVLLPLGSELMVVCRAHACSTAHEPGWG